MVFDRPKGVIAYLQPALDQLLRPHPELDQLFLAQSPPDQLFLTQPSPVHPEPLHEFFDHEFLVHDSPDHEFLVHVTEPQVEPAKDVPFQASPVQASPLKTPPTQLTSPRAAEAHDAAFQGVPKMSCSPLSSTSLEASRLVPRAPSSEPRPVASVNVWGASTDQGV